MPSSQSSVKGLAITERYRTLLEINNAIITNLTQQALLHAISEALHRVISFHRCAITLYQPGKDTFRFLAVEGERPSDYFTTGLEVERSETCISWVFDHQQPLLRRNLEEERQYANEHRLASEGMQSLCVLPLVFQGKCVGTLSFVSLERDRYSNEDAAFLQEVANQVALAVSNMTSYEEIAALNTRVELTAARYRTLLEVNNAIVSHLSQQDLLHSISAILRRFLPLDGASITLYNAKNDTFHYFSMENTNLSDHLRHGAQFNRENSVSAWVFDHQRPVVRRDLIKEQQYSNDRRLIEIGIASDCIVPMIVAGKSIGTLNVGSKKKDQYSEAETELLQEVANQVGIAVSNMISYEEIAALSARVEHTAERYRKVLEVNNAIVTHLNRGDLMHSIAEILHRFLPFDGAAITFYVPESDVFRSFALETMISTDFLRVGMEIPRRESMVTEIFENQRGRIRRDLEKEQRFANDHRLLEIGIVFRLHCSPDRRRQEHRHTRHRQAAEEPILRSRHGAFAGSSQSSRAGRCQHGVLRGNRATEGPPGKGKRLPSGRDPHRPQLRRNHRQQRCPTGGTAQGGTGGANRLHGSDPGRDRYRKRTDRARDS
jgi:GAF domain-containing protein